MSGEKTEELNYIIIVVVIIIIIIIMYLTANGMSPRVSGYNACTTNTTTAATTTTTTNTTNNNNNTTTRRNISDLFFSIFVYSNEEDAKGRRKAKINEIDRCSIIPVTLFLHYSH
jgi:p-aminobenzoyl-glutamate transporter AbgT